MSKVFIEPIHGEAQINLVADLLAGGHQVIGPTEKIFDYGYPHVCDWIEVRNKMEHVSAANLHKAGIDVVWCGTYAQCSSAVSLGKRLGKPVILAASVNNMPYKEAESPYLVSTDLMTFQKAPIRHKIFYAPAPDTIFGPPSPVDAPREKTAVSLIVKHNQQWPDKYALWLKISERYSKQMRFEHHETLSRYQVADKLKKVSVLVHLKGCEGWGWSLAQAAVSGCPVIVNGDLPPGRSCGLFLKHGVNAWFLDTGDPIGSFGRAMQEIPSLLKDQGRYAMAALNCRRYLAGLSEFVSFAAQNVGLKTPPTVRNYLA